MPDFTQIFQKQLDPSQFCPICQASMHFVEAELYQKNINFLLCAHCEHHIYYGDQPLQCHCKACINKRKKQIQEARFSERKIEWQKKHEKQDNIEFLLDDLNLLDKLFLLSLLDGMVDSERPHDEFINFEHYYPLQISPSYQLFKSQKQQFIQHYYLLNKEEHSEKYFTNIKLQGYREPSLLSITQQLRHWFYQDLTQGIPYKDSEEVKQTLLTLLAHEILNYCQYLCQKWQIQFYANQQFIDYCKVLLADLAVTQIYYLVQKALSYLHEKKLLEASNKGFVNTNRLRKTLIQYRERGQQEHWETANLDRPHDLPYSQMSYIFIDRFLQFGSQIFKQPVWKCWQDIVPRLRFFTERHCIHCGSKDLVIEYSKQDYVSFSCLKCKQQDHYFIK